MDSQKPLTGGAPPPGGGGSSSASDTISALLRTIILHFMPPLWARRAIAALIVVYFMPDVLAKWLNSLARLIIMYRNWRRGDDFVQTTQRPSGL